MSDGINARYFVFFLLSGFAAFCMNWCGCGCYDAQLLKDDRVDEKALLNLRGVVRTSYVTLNGRSYENLEAFAPEADWEALDCTSLPDSDGRGGSDGL